MKTIVRNKREILSREYNLIVQKRRLKEKRDCKQNPSEWGRDSERKEEKVRNMKREWVGGSANEKTEYDGRKRERRKKTEYDV